MELSFWNVENDEKREEIIKLLESFGGERCFKPNRYKGAQEFFYLESESTVNHRRKFLEDPNIPVYVKPFPIRPTTMTEKLFTLEDFLNKFPFDVGDKVKYSGKTWTIIKKSWDEKNETVRYDLRRGRVFVDQILNISAEELKTNN